MITKQRRFEIIRRILLELDKSDDPMPLLLSQFTDCPDLDDDELDYFIERMLAYGLIQDEVKDTYELTWDGHDFIGMSSDPVIWQAAMQIAGHLSFDCFHSILKDLMFWKARKIAEQFSERESGQHRRK